MGKKELVTRMQKEISSFQTRFYIEFGVRLQIAYKIETSLIPKTVTLTELEEIGDRHHPGAVRSRSRKRELVNIRQVIFRIAMELGYGPTEIGKKWEWDHATILHGSNHTLKLLETNDPITTETYNYLIYEVKQLVNSKGDIQHPITEGVIPQSVLSSGLHARLSEPRQNHQFGLRAKGIAGGWVG